MLIWACVFVCVPVCTCDPLACLPPECLVAESCSIATGNAWLASSPHLRQSDHSLTLTGLNVRDTGTEEDIRLTWKTQQRRDERNERKKKKTLVCIHVCLLSACCMSHLCSWVWSCSIEPGHWGRSNIQWHLIPPAYNQDCTRSESQLQQQSCYPYGGHYGALGLSCTG